MLQMLLIHVYLTPCNGSNIMMKDITDVTYPPCISVTLCNGSNIMKDVTDITYPCIPVIQFGKGLKGILRYFAVCLSIKA